jgi:hypothetical protein
MGKERLENGKLKKSYDALKTPTSGSWNLPTFLLT